MPEPFPGSTGRYGNCNDRVMHRRDLLRLLSLSAMAGAAGRAYAASAFPPDRQTASTGFVPDVELSLTASNLSDARHAEWGVAPGRAEIERSLFVKLLWRL